jgi:hypothetical protein
MSNELNKAIENLNKIRKTVLKEREEYSKLQRQLIKAIKDHTATIKAFGEMVDQYKELEKVCILQDKKIILLEQQIIDMHKTDQDFILNNHYEKRKN